MIRLSKFPTVPPKLYPLSSMSATANRAYSFRKLRSAYSGPLIQVRRSSDNATTDVSPDVNQIVSGSSAVSVGGDLATWKGSDTLFLSIWYDQSVSLVNATQGSNSSQMQLIFGGNSSTNFKMVAVGAGAQYMTVGSPITGPSSLTISSVVGNIVSQAFVNVIFNAHRSADTNTLFRHSIPGSDTRIQTTFINSANTSILNLFNAGTAIGTRLNQFMTVATNSTVLTGFNYQNGSQIATGSSALAWANALAPDDYQIAGNTSNPRFFVGNLAELIFFTTNLSAADRTILANSQRYFWSTG